MFTASRDISLPIASDELIGQRHARMKLTEYAGILGQDLDHFRRVLLIFSTNRSILMATCLNSLSAQFF
jgi:hypothetical protein